MKKTLIQTILVALCLTGCQGKSKSSNSLPSPDHHDQGDLTNNDDSQAKQPDLSNEEVRKVSLAAFEQSVYPIVKVACASCHADQVQPFFAQDDVEAAHDEIVNGKKVNFVNVASSRLVARMGEGHNCIDGDCEKAKTTMLGAVTQWAEALKNAGHQPEHEDGQRTEDIAINSVTETSQPDPNSIGMTAEQGTNVIAPFVLRKDDADGPINGYLIVPTRTNVVVTEGQTGATSDFRLNVPAQGTYYVWGRIKAPNGNANAFNVRVGNGNFVAYNTPVNPNWAWVRLNDTQNNAVPFNLAAGTTRVQVKQREENTKINQIVLTTTKDGFNGIVERKVRTLTYDLSALTGANAKLTVIVEAFGTDGKSYLLSSPSITTDKPLHVKDLQPLINGAANPLHATFKIIDMTVNPPGAPLSSSTLVVATDGSMSTDTIGFSFGKIE